MGKLIIRSGNQIMDLSESILVEFEIDNYANTYTINGLIDRVREEAESIRKVNKEEEK